jgi:hypothetical protein
LGWSAEQAAGVYGKALKGVPITGKAYLKMEEGYLPKSLKRRAVLASMLGIAPAFLLPDIATENFEDSITPKSKALNLKEYRTNMVTTWKNGYQGSADEILRDTLRRINTLHNKVLYANTIEQEEMKQLLCGYQIWYGDLAREQDSYTRALEHYNMAVTLAHQEKYTDIEAAAICRRGNLYLDQYKLKPALQDFQQAASFEVSDQLKGHILSLLSLTQMRLAHTDQERTAALQLMDSTENMADAPVEETVYLAQYPVGRYLRFRANILMAAPMKKLRSSTQAAEILDELELRNRRDTSTDKRHNVYHQVECNLAYARIFQDQEYYPVVTTLLQDTLKLTQEVNSKVHLHSILNIHDDLKVTDYGKEESVAELGVAITKAQYPKFFN